MPQANKEPRIAVILAGGSGRRMGGADKGELRLGGRRLIDHVLRRIGPQVDRVLICGSHDFGAGLPVVKDREDGPRGPAAGLWAALHWIEKNEPKAGAFATAPADGPFVPLDLVSRLACHDGSSVAANDSRSHPTFACWKIAALRSALQLTEKRNGLALHDLADTLHSKRVLFDDAKAFFNINTPEDLAQAESLLNG